MADAPKGTGTKGADDVIVDSGGKKGNYGVSEESFDVIPDPGDKHGAFGTPPDESFDVIPDPGSKQGSYGAGN
jgi:hypothetical protein